jgi:hypothetical protein
MRALRETESREVQKDFSKGGTQMAVRQVGQSSEGSLKRYMT